jgi:hypothetical protein
MNLLTRAAVSAGEAMVIVAVVTLVRECDPVGVFLIRVIRLTGEWMRISQLNGFHGVLFGQGVRPKALKLFVLAVIACECEKMPYPSSSGGVLRRSRVQGHQPA